MIRMFKIFLILIIIHSCTEEPSADISQTDIVTLGSILDVGNNNNASDLLISFFITDIRLADEIRLFIIPASQFDTIDGLNINEVQSSSYQAVRANQLIYKFRLSSTLLDILGNPIIDDLDYVIAFATILDGMTALNSRTYEFRKTPQNFLVGKYIGTWNDNLYTDFGISAELKNDGQNLSGPFFYSESFSSCCSGENDGNIRIVVEGNDINSFFYAQNLASFQGGPCQGSYEGNGKVIIDDNGISLEVTFEGNDCEGPHTGGRIVLSRVE